MIINKIHKDKKLHKDISEKIKDKCECDNC